MPLDKQSVLANKLGMSIEAVLYGLLIFMPAAFGVVHAWSEEIVILAAAALLALSAAWLWFSHEKATLSWALVPVAVFLLVPAFQLIPLPASVVKSIAPNTYKIKTELLSKLTVQPEGSSQQAVEGQESQASSLKPQVFLDKMPLTFYPNATWRGFRLVVAIAGIFFVTLQYFTTSERIKRLLVCITSVGGAVAILTILQFTSRADKIYWTVSLPRGDLAEAGPFVNHSNFGQFANASIGAAIALVMIKFHELFTGRVVPMDSRNRSSEIGNRHLINSHNPVVLISEIADYLTSPAGRWFWAVCGMVILTMASIFISMTRGGMLTMLIAAAFTTLLLTLRGSIKGRGWIMAIMALGAFVCVLWIGFDAVYDRLATLSDLQKAESGRFQILNDIATAWTKFPIFGTGLNTHSVVYPMFDRSTIPALAAHAENEYAQGLEELGIAGFVPLLIFAVIIWTAYARCIRQSKKPLCSAAYGLGFGLLAILLHSFSDFGQHLPANAVLTAIYSALLIGLAKKQGLVVSKQEGAGGQASQVSNLKPHVLKRTQHLKLTTQNYTAISVASLTAVILLFTVFAPGGTDDARIAEKYWKTAQRSATQLDSIDWAGSSAQYADLLRNAERAVTTQPNNVEYCHWLNVWRWRTMSRLTDETGRVILPARAMGHIQRLCDEFAGAVATCPTYGASWTLAGQLQYFVLGKQDAGADWIQTGVQLAPCDATACFVAGLLEVEEYKKQGLGFRRQAAGDQDIDESANDHQSAIVNDNLQSTAPGYAHFARAIELDGHFFEDVAGVYLSIDRPDLVVELAGDNIGWLNRSAQLLAETDADSELVNAARQKLFDLLIKKSQAPDIDPGTLASLASLYAAEEMSDEAIDLYRRALTADYDNIAWRLSLARLLGETGDPEAAIKECKIILRLKPNYTPAIRLIEQLSVK